MSERTGLVVLVLARTDEAAAPSLVDAWDSWRAHAHDAGGRVQFVFGETP
jgi:hypothetical protein